MASSSAQLIAAGLVGGDELDAGGVERAAHVVERAVRQVPGGRASGGHRPASRQAGPSLERCGPSGSPGWRRAAYQRSSVRNSTARPTGSTSTRAVAVLPWSLTTSSKVLSSTAPMHSRREQHRRGHHDGVVDPGDQFARRRTRDQSIGDGDQTEECAVHAPHPAQVGVGAEHRHDTQPRRSACRRPRRRGRHCCTARRRTAATAVPASSELAAEPRRSELCRGRPTTPTKRR